MHFEHLGRLKTRVATDAYASVERKDVLLLLGQALHAADISNPTKEVQTMVRWTERVMKEFWLQGDREAALGLPISAFMDRKQLQVQTCQIGFINVLVKPLYVEFTSILGDKGISECLRCLESNFDGWTEYQRRCSEDGATEPWTEFMATRAKELADERARLNRRPSLAASLSGRAGAQVHPQ